MCQQSYLIDLKVGKNNMSMRRDGRKNYDGHTFHYHNSPRPNHIWFSYLSVQFLAAIQPHVKVMGLCDSSCGRYCWKSRRDVLDGQIIDTISKQIL